MFNSKKNLVSFVCLVIAYGHSTPCFAENHSLPEVTSRVLHPSFSKPFGKAQDIRDDFSRAMNRVLNGSSSLRDALGRTLEDNGLGRQIGIREKSLNKQINLTGTGTSSSSFRFFVNDMPVCGHEVRAHEVQGESPALLGSYPSTDADMAPSREDWPRLSDIQPMVIQALGERYNVNLDSVKITPIEACVGENQGRWEPYWILNLRTERHLFRAVTSEFEVIQLDPAYFDVDGLAKVYEKNPTTSLKDFTLKDLTGEGILKNTYFATELNGKTRASSSTHQFVFSTSDKRFDEASSFTHASEMMSWYVSMGFSFAADSKRITIDLHSTDPDLENNAQYIPGDASTASVIQIGDGDGVSLANLPRDSDVVSHELGHHIIYQTLTSTSGESLVLHEGIADFMAFAHSGDACLGESICPTTSRYCVVKGKCLRTAENTYKYGEADLPDEAHLRSQFISGMLWDLRAGGSVPAADLSPLVFKALGYLLESSGYFDFVASLMISDRNNYGGKYCSSIVNAAKNRGLGTVISTLDCSQELQSLLGSQKQQTSSTTSSNSKSSGGGGLCGTIVRADQGADFKSSSDQRASWQLLLNILLMLAPIVLATVIRRAPRHAKASK